MTTRQPIRRKSWGAWFPIVRGMQIGWDLASGPDQTAYFVIRDGLGRPASQSDIAANRELWGMKP